MKKATALLLLFLFLFSNSGMSVNVHWCKEKITSIKFFEDDGHPCKCGKKAMKPGCCKDKTVTIKAKTDPAKVNQFSFKTFLPKFEFNSALRNKIFLPLQLQYYTSDFYHPPPFKLRAPIFLLDKVIRI